MSANVLTIEAAQKANLAIQEDAAGVQAIHDAVTAARANRRSGTASTKTRGEVAATGKKPFRQKGTGNARQGGNASPIHRGGGIVFGPRPRSYAKNINRKTKRLAFASAFGQRVAAGDVLTVDSLEVADGKTKSFVAQLGAAVDAPRVLVISDSFTDKTYLAARNVADTQLVTASDVNTENLLRYDKVVITSAGLAVLAQRINA